VAQGRAWLLVVRTGRGKSAQGRGGGGSRRKTTQGGTALGRREERCWARPARRGAAAAWARAPGSNAEAGAEASQGIGATGARRSRRKGERAGRRAPRGEYLEGPGRVGGEGCGGAAQEKKCEEARVT
jgi:hypothetical protein